MEFKTFYLSLSTPEREALATKLGTTTGLLRNIAYGTRSIGEILALRLERLAELPINKTHPLLADELAQAGYKQHMSKS